MSPASPVFRRRTSALPRLKWTTSKNCTTTKVIWVTTRSWMLHPQQPTEEFTSSSHAALVQLIRIVWITRVIALAIVIIIIVVALIIIITIIIIQLVVVERSSSSNNNRPSACGVGHYHKIRCHRIHRRRPPATARCRMVMWGERVVVGVPTSVSQNSPEKTN